MNKAGHIPAALYSTSDPGTVHGFQIPEHSADAGSYTQAHWFPYPRYRPSRPGPQKNSVNIPSIRPLSKQLCNSLILKISVRLAHKFAVCNCRILIMFYYIIELFLLTRQNS